MADHRETLMQLAQYFTGQDVAYHSVMLEMPKSADAQRARRFFDMRAALGIVGYMNQREAADAAHAALNIHDPKPSDVL